MLVGVFVGVLVGVKEGVGDGVEVLVAVGVAVDEAVSEGLRNASTGRTAEELLAKTVHCKGKPNHREIPTHTASKIPIQDKIRGMVSFGRCAGWTGRLGEILR